MITTASTPTNFGTSKMLNRSANKLAEKKPPPAWLKFFDPFKSVLVRVLAAAISHKVHAGGFIGSSIMNTRFAPLLLTQFLSVSSTGWINNEMVFL